MNKPHILALDQKENAKHGETLFPMQKYITRLAADYPVVSMHWHEEAELTLITKGDCTYQIDFVTYEAKKGDILFVPPLLLHSISRRTSDEFFSETYVFHMNFFGWKHCGYLLHTLSDSANESRAFSSLPDNARAFCLCFAAENFPSNNFIVQ